MFVGQGSKGEQGSPGPDGADGQDGSDGLPGSPGPQVCISTGTFGSSLSKSYISVTSLQRACVYFK